MLCLRVESTSFHSKLIEIVIFYYSVTKMNSQSNSTNEQTSRSLVEDTRVQSSTDGVGPSTGQEGRRVGAASPGTSGSSDTEMRKKMKVVKLPGNEHLSLVDAEDESKVICHIFPFPAGQYTQILGERNGAEASMRPMDEERCQIIHTLAGSHFLPVKFAAQLTAAIRSMQPGDMLQLSRHRPVEEGSKICWEVEVKLYNGRFRGWDFETEAKMTREKMTLLDTGRVVQQDIRISSAPVPESDLVRFHMCGPPDCDYEEVRECHQQIGECNYAKLHQRLTKMRVTPSTSTVQVQIG